jgi:hypothetical protein
MTHPCPKDVGEYHVSPPHSPGSSFPHKVRCQTPKGPSSSRLLEEIFPRSPSQSVVMVVVVPPPSSPPPRFTSGFRLPPSLAHAWIPPFRAMLERLFATSSGSFFSNSSIPSPCFPIFSNSSINFFMICGGCFFFDARSRAGMALITKCNNHSFGRGW